MTKQPQWKRIANLGDVNPVEYGGYFVYTDRTKVYPPEAELLRTPDDGGEGWTIHRFILDRCTFVDGVLSDNAYHPELPTWFAKDLAAVASFIGSTELDLINGLCSDDPIDRASAYRAIGEYHGFDNFDGYPRQYTKRSELPRRILRKG
jgi:hypothetical protein